MEEIKATILSVNNNEFYVEIPRGDFWENGTEAKFIICFSTKADKSAFLEQCKTYKDFELSGYRYSKFRIYNIRFTNMVRCRANKELDTTHILEDFFNGEVPF